MKKPKVDPSAPQMVTVPIGEPKITKKWGTPRVEISPLCRLDMDSNLRDMIQQLTDIQACYTQYTDMFIDSDEENYYGETARTYYYVAGTRLETQLEVDFRLSEEKRLKENKEEQERKEYERLKKKFGDGKGDKK